MAIIDRDTFDATTNTVEVTLRNETRRLNAKMFDDGMIIAKGLVGRYQSATKPWPASVMSRMHQGTVVEQARFGRDDRNPKFRKENAIWFKD